MFSLVNDREKPASTVGEGVKILEMVDAGSIS